MMEKVEETSGNRQRRALAVWEPNEIPGGAKALWRIPVCPFCGREHVHGCPSRREPGHRLSHCADIEPGNYALVEVSGHLAETLREIASNPAPLQIVDGLGSVISRHRDRRSSALAALRKAARTEPAAALVDRRIIRLGEVMREVDRMEAEARTIGARVSGLQHLNFDAACARAKRKPRDVMRGLMLAWMHGEIETPLERD